MLHPHKRFALILASICLLVAATACQTRAKQARLMPVDSRYQGMDAVEAIDAFIASAQIDKTDPLWKTKLPRPPRVGFDPEKTYFWTIKTNLGDMKVKLIPESAPMHVSNVIYLSRLQFYNGLSFHRVIPKFMAQGGDPLGNGSGGPGYRIAGEFYGKEKHKDAGVVSSANRGPRTDGSQFFITFDTQEELNGKHTIFGQVVEGVGTLKGLEVRGSEDGTPRAPMEIRRTRIRVE